MNSTFARIAYLAAVLCGALLGLAAPDEATAQAVDNSTGCVVRDPAGSYLIRPGMLTDRERGAAVVDARRRLGAKVLDPCYSGRGVRMPTRAYENLVQRFPATYRPIAAQGNRPARHPLPPVPPPPIYGFESLDALLAPKYQLFAPAFIDNQGRIYGQAEAFDAEGNVLSNDVVVVKNGVIQSVAPGGYVVVANQHGLAGGLVFTDISTGTARAAVFEGSTTRLLPARPGEVFAYVMDINEDGDLLVWSQDASFNTTTWLVESGRWTQLNFDAAAGVVLSTYLGRDGVVMGTMVVAVDPASFDTSGRGYRLNAHSGALETINPAYPGDTDVSIQGVNSRSEALGYSYVPYATEHIGIWDRKLRFQTYFTEGTSQFPTVSNVLIASDNNLIGILAVRSPDDERGNVYLVTAPGVRVNLGDVVLGIPPEAGPIAWIVGINNGGSIVGDTANGVNFLLTPRGAQP